MDPIKKFNAFVIQNIYSSMLALNGYIRNPKIPKAGMNFDTLET
jgi:hypothetical protein